MDHLELIKKILSENSDFGCRLESQEITPQHQIQKDLGLDSIGLMSLIYELQEKYPDLDEEQMTNWTTVQDLINAINDHAS